MRNPLVTLGLHVLVKSDDHFVGNLWGATNCAVLRNGHVFLQDAALFCSAFCCICSISGYHVVCDGNMGPH